MTAYESFILARVLWKISSTISDARVVIDKAYQLYFESKAALDSKYETEKQQLPITIKQITNEEEKAYVEDCFDSYFEEEYSSSDIFLKQQLEMLIMFLFSSYSGVKSYINKICDETRNQNEELSRLLRKVTKINDHVEELNLVDNCIKHEDSMVGKTLHKAFPGKYKKREKIVLSFEIIESFYKDFEDGLYSLKREVEQLSKKISREDGTGL